MTAIATPLVPIVSFLQHWDHHWYVWLPGDPVYEAVEIMAAERGPNRPPLLWVFFTERAVPKRQVNYYSDAEVAAARAAEGTTAQFADIKFVMTGSEGEPRGVAAEFVNAQNRKVTIGVDLIAARRSGPSAPASPIRSAIAASACCCCFSGKRERARRILA